MKDRLIRMPLRVQNQGVLVGTVQVIVYREATEKFGIGVLGVVSDVSHFCKDLFFQMVNLILVIYLKLCGKLLNVHLQG